MMDVVYQTTWLSEYVPQEEQCYDNNSSSQSVWVDIEDKLVTLGLSCLHQGTMLDLTATES